MNSEQVSGVFNDLMTSPVEMIIWLAIIVVFGFFVCSRGLQKGIEKVSKVMMVALLALIVILAINSMMLSNAGEGLSFYLVPDFGKVKDVGTRQGNHICNESGILHTRTRNRINGNFRQLYEQRPHALR